jgi:hypothetical protein
VIKDDVHVCRVSSFLLELCQASTGFIGFCLVVLFIRYKETNFLGYEMKFIETPMGPAFIALYIGMIIG